YPTSARQAEVQGNVRVDVVISSDGRLTSMYAAYGPFLLMPAALQVVWARTYEPTIVDGHKVDVATEIIIPFRLDG
ncbi:MAG: hypothetical protein GY953_56325, partial [bacterium]|nr:hypothetical protein [bacterium]